MNINELCIGDWISYINRKYKVIQIDKEGIIYGQGSDFSAPGIAKQIKSIDPIKITSEVLKHSFNDICIEVGGYWMTEIDNYFVEFYPSTGTFIKYTYIVDEYNKYTQHIILLLNCYYMHELQHALRLAGIEKDIIFYE